MVQPYRPTSTEESLKSYIFIMYKSIQISSCIIVYKCVKYTFWPFLHILKQKKHYISPSKIMHNHLKFSTSYSTRVNLHGHCSMCISFLLISVRINFSLSSPCTTTLMEKQTNPNGKTNKPKQEKKKRDRSVLIGMIGARGSRLVGARGYGS